MMQEVASKKNKDPGGKCLRQFDLFVFIYFFLLNCSLILEDAFSLAFHFCVCQVLKRDCEVVPK